MRAIYYDTETTGINPEKDRIVEIAAYDPVLNRTFHTLVNPQMLIPPDAIAIHHITNEMVADAPTFAEAGASFIKFCEGKIALVAHNNDQFDSQFLKHEGDRHQLPFPSWPMIDSLKWARKYRPDLPRHSLQYLRQIYGVPENQAHRALDDVLVLHQVFSMMIDDLSIDTVLFLMQSQAIPSTHHVMPFGKYQGKPFSQVPSSYIKWLLAQGALDKPENKNLKSALQMSGLL